MNRFMKGLMALAVALSATTAIAAAPVKDMYRTNGNGAQAEWYNESEGVGHYTFILGDASNQGNLVEVQTCDIDTLTYAYTCWTGVAFPSGTVFTMDKKMNTATLSPVSVDLWDDSYSTFKTVTVQASWTADGSPLKTKTNYLSKYGTFKENYHGRTTLRNATATALIDGNAPVGFLDALMAKYSSADFYMVH